MLPAVKLVNKICITERRKTMPFLDSTFFSKAGSDNAIMHYNKLSENFSSE